MPPEPREQGTMTYVMTRFLLVFGGLNADLQVARLGSNLGSRPLCSAAVPDALNCCRV